MHVLSLEAKCMHGQREAVIMTVNVLNRYLVAVIEQRELILNEMRD